MDEIAHDVEARKITCQIDLHCAVEVEVRIIYLDLTTEIFFLECSVGGDVGVHIILVFKAGYASFERGSKPVDIEIAADDLTLEIYQSEVRIVEKLSDVEPDRFDIARITWLAMWWQLKAYVGANAAKLRTEGAGSYEIVYGAVESTIVQDGAQRWQVR